MRLEDNNMGWIERLQQAERLTGLEKRDLARRCRVKYSTYCNYLAGKTQPKFEVFIRMCRVFNISPGYILRDEPEGTEQERTAYAAFDSVLRERGPIATAALLYGSSEPAKNVVRLDLPADFPSEDERADCPRRPFVRQSEAVPSSPGHPPQVKLDGPPPSQGRTEPGSGTQR